MSIWVVIFGTAVSLNCLLAWASRSHGSKCLSMWIGAGFMLGLTITTASRIVPSWTVFDYPWQNLVMSIADLGLLAWLMVILRKNHDLHNIGRLLFLLQCLSLFSHWIDLTTFHSMKRIYYGALDVIEALMIILNLHKSARHGIQLDILLPGMRPLHPHSGRDGQ